MAEIRCPLYESSLISKHEPAITGEEQPLLYYDFEEEVAYAAQNLCDAGCRPGERVALFLGTDWRYPVLLLALMRLGAVACPVHTRLPPAAVAEQLRSIACRKIIAFVDPRNRGILGDLEVLDPWGLTERTEHSRRFEWNQRMELNRPATLLFTSGSSGAPKAVVHSYGNHYYSARGSNVNIRIGSHQSWLLTLPLFHVGGLGVMFRCIMAGTALAIPNAKEALPDAIRRLRPTHLSLVPTQLQRLMQLEDPELWTGIQSILLGGAPVGPQLLRTALARKLPVWTSYGLTEMASQVATMPPDAPPSKRLTSGKLLRHRQLKLAADGEILVRGETRFLGYAEGEALRQPFDAEQWFATGDLGALDAEGYLSVLGRKDNMFISGGENIHPEEIERALLMIPGIQEAVVVPVPHGEFGERPVAFVRCEGRRDPADWEAALGHALPGYKRPDAYLEFPQSPEGESLKVDRQALRAVALKKLKT